MPVLEEAKFNNLCTHYKDSYDIHLGTRKEREIVFYALLIVTSFFSFQISSIDTANGIIADVLKQTGGITIDKKSGVIPSLFWLLLFGLSTKFYQIHTRIEREYAYLHKIEDLINAHYPSTAAFTREGKSYLTNYPKISDLIHFLYNFIFPLMIILSITTRVYKDEFSYFNSILFLSILSTTLTYMFWMNQDDLLKIWIKVKNNKMKIIFISVLYIFLIYKIYKYTH